MNDTIMTLADRTTDFIMNNTTYTDRDKVRQFVVLHNLYGTSITAVKDGNIVGYCRWNILEDNETAELLDIIVDKYFRRKGLLLELADKGFPYWRHIKYIRFERGYDDGTNNKRKKTYLISKLWRRLQNADDYFGGSTSTSVDAVHSTPRFNCHW